jgi:protein TonB
MNATWKFAVLVLLLLGCAGSKPPQTEVSDNGDWPEAKITVVSPKMDQAPEPVGGMAALQASVEQPEEVMKQNKSAQVIVEAKIDINGRVAGTKVAKSSGYKNVDAAAMLAVSRVQWKSGRKKGEPVAATVQVPIYFSPQH